MVQETTRTPYGCTICVLSLLSYLGVLSVWAGAPADGARELQQLPLPGHHHQEHYAENIYNLKLQK